MEIEAILPKEQFCVTDWINLEGLERTTPEGVVLPNIYMIHNNIQGTGEVQRIEIWPNLIPDGPYKNTDRMPDFPVRIRRHGNPRSKAIFMAYLNGDKEIHGIDDLSQDLNPWPDYPTP